MELTYSLSAIQNAAQWLVAAAQGRRIWLMEAPMGSGKTTLTAAVAAVLGAAEAASSPTYGIIQEYPLSKGPWTLMAHMDWYRLRDEEEAMMAGVEEYLSRPNCLCIIEWPEHAVNLLAGLNAMTVTIDIEGNEDRKLATT